MNNTLSIWKTSMLILSFTLFFSLDYDIVISSTIVHIPSDNEPIIQENHEKNPGDDYEKNSLESFEELTEKEKKQIGILLEEYKVGEDFIDKLNNNKFVWHINNELKIPELIIIDENNNIIKPLICNHTSETRALCTFIKDQDRTVILDLFQFNFKERNYQYINYKYGFIKGFYLENCAYSQDYSSAILLGSKFIGAIKKNPTVEDIDAMNKKLNEIEANRTYQGKTQYQWKVLNMENFKYLKQEIKFMSLENQKSIKDIEEQKKNQAKDKDKRQLKVIALTCFILWPIGAINCYYYYSQEKKKLAEPPHGYIAKNSNFILANENKLQKNKI